MPTAWEERQRRIAEAARAEAASEEAAALTMELRAIYGLRGMSAQQMRAMLPRRPTPAPAPRPRPTRSLEEMLARATFK